MYQRVNLSWKVAVQNAGCVSAYFCSGYKNSFWLWSRSSFKVFFFNLEGHKIEKFAFGNVFPRSSSQTRRFSEKHEAIFFYHHQISEALVRRSSFKKCFFEIFCQILRKTPVNVSLSCSYTHCLFKKKHQHRCFL